MESEKQFSLHVSRALDCLGKSQDMVKFRVDKYKKWEHSDTFVQRLLKDSIMAGSKGEGLTAPFENDYDNMAVFVRVFCADDTSPFLQLPDCSVFETERMFTSPGYTKLRLARLHCLDPRFRESLIKDGNDNLYMSSDFFIQHLIHIFPKDDHQIILDRSGPAIPTVGKEIICNQDTVFALPCICPQITQSFMKRPRYYGWPSHDQLIDISSFEGHVVPVGYKGSDTAFLEWRICFTEAERFLIRNLNDTQTKLYILLKMVAKTCINSTVITSYVLKNVILWLAECQDHTTFKNELLVDRFIQALNFLRICINNNYLPSYIIPDRNLFSGKLDIVQRKNMVCLLTELINQDGGLFMSCERLRGTMIVLYKEPARAEQYRFKRDMIEKLYLSSMEIRNERQAAGASEEQRNLSLHTNDKFFKLAFPLMNLIFEDNLSLIHAEGAAPITLIMITERLQQWLS